MIVRQVKDAIVAFSRLGGITAERISRETGVDVGRVRGICRALVRTRQVRKRLSRLNSGWIYYVPTVEKERATRARTFRESVEAN